MNHSTIRVGLVIFIGTASISALAQTYTLPTGELYQIWQEKQAYFDVLRTQMTEEEFYQEGGEYALFQKWFHHWYVRTAPHGDPEVYALLMKNYCDAKFFNGGSYKTNNDPWLELGPTRRAAAMVGIGPIRNIVFYRDDPDHMLCTSTHGGLFYSVNGGTNWQNAGTDLGWRHSGCWDAVYYPGDPNAWYALSTLDVDGFIQYTGGVYRTTTGGATWDRIADNDVIGPPNTSTRKLYFSQNPNSWNDHTLFLTFAGGLLRCENPSAPNPTWNLVTQTGLPTAIDNAYPGATMDAVVRCEDIEHMPSDPSVLCASMRYTGTYNNVPFAVWRFMLSTDDGFSWNEAPNHPAIDLATNNATIETSSAAPNSFYCLSVSSPETVKTYDHSTGVWTQVVSNFYSQFHGGHGFGVDQFDANSVYVSNGTGLQRYVNGIATGIANGHADVEDIVGHPTISNKVWVANHGGVSVITVNGSSTSWVDRSDGLGVAEVWSMSTSQNKPDFIAVALNHDHTAITRTPYVSNAWDPDWAELDLTGDGTHCIIAREDANLVYHSVQNGAWRRNDNAETSNAVSDNISIQSQFDSKGAVNRLNGEHLYRATKVHTLPNSTYNGNPNYENKEAEVFRSFDRGVTDVAVSDFAHNFEVCRPAVGDMDSNTVDYIFDHEQFWWIRTTPANTDHLYVGLVNWDWQHRIFRTTMIDNPDVQTVKASWQEIPHPRRVPLFEPIRDAVPVGIAFDPENENIIYVAYNSSRFNDPADHDSPIGLKMVYRLDLTNISLYPVTGSFDCNGGLPCADLTMNLPNTIVDLDCFAYEQGSDGGLYLATEVGVYFTNNKRIAAHDPQNPADPDDLGNTSGWVRLGDGLPHVTTRGLEINYNVNRIRIGLNGRGVWEHGLHCPPEYDIAESGTYAADAFLEAEHDISSTAIVPNGQNIKYRGGNTVALTPGFHATVGSAFHAFIHPCDDPGNSFQPKDLNSAPWVELADREQLAGDGRMTLFPNPAEDRLTVMLAGSVDDAISTIRLIDVLGKEVLRASVQGFSLELDVSQLQGPYMVLMDHASVRYYKKVIIN